MHDRLPRCERVWIHFHFWLFPSPAGRFVLKTTLQKVAKRLQPILKVRIRGISTRSCSRRFWFCFHHRPGDSARTTFDNGRLIYHADLAKLPAILAHLVAVIPPDLGILLVTTV